MVAPLVMLAATLLSKKLQEQEQNAAYKNQLAGELATVKANIAARRAARAGDSGYMQAAMGGAANFSPAPRPIDSLSGIGEALLKQREAPKLEQAAAQENANTRFAPIEVQNGYPKEAVSFGNGQGFVGNDYRDLEDDTQYA